MMEPGRCIGRDISAGERTEAELAAMIERRHEVRVRDEGERPAEEAWMESERRHGARRHEENIVAWHSYLMDSADNIERTAAEIAAEKRAKAARLMGADELETSA